MLKKGMLRCRLKMLKHWMKDAEYTSTSSSFQGQSFTLAWYRIGWCLKTPFKHNNLGNNIYIYTYVYIYIYICIYIYILYIYIL